MHVCKQKARQSLNRFLPCHAMVGERACVQMHVAGHAPAPLHPCHTIDHNAMAFMSAASRDQYADIRAFSRADHRMDMHTNQRIDFESAKLHLGAAESDMPREQHSDSSMLISRQ